MTPRPLNSGGSRSSSRWFIKTIVVLNMLFLFPIVILMAFNLVGPERWWVTSFLQFLPTWPWAVPPGVLLLPTLLTAQRYPKLRSRYTLMLLPVAALLMAIGPLMGLCINWPAADYQTNKEKRLRVLTYNVKWGRRGDVAAIAREIINGQPDLVQMQDAGNILSGEVGKILAPANGWTVRVSGQYIVASRWKISELSDIDISVVGTRQHAVKAIMTPPGGGQPVTVYNVHLWTPRYGLTAIRNRNKEGLEVNVDERGSQAVRLAIAVRQTSGPVLLTGDLNAPPYSLVNQNFKSVGLRNAFEQSGFGYGYTYGARTRAGRPYVRLDHILASDHFRVGSTRVGNGTGSEHCPVFAELYLRRS